MWNGPFKIPLHVIRGIDTKCLKTTSTEPSDNFLHLKETLLDTRWEIESFRLFLIFFLAVGLVCLDTYSLNHSNAPNTKK